MPLLETKGAASAQGFGLTLGGEEPTYIEDVFSTWLYTGTGASQTHTNNIDLSTKGGLVWLKRRSSTENHYLQDSSSSFANSLSSNTTAAAIVGSGVITSVSTTGFTTSSVSNGTTYASWTFRKQPKFFDVVTYTGDGLDRTIPHNLGSVPGCVIVKCTSSGGSATYNWVVGHRSLAANEFLQLNTTDQKFSGASVFNTNNVPNTSTTFSVGTNAITNQSGQTYVAYLFAHDAGGFGLTGTDNVISCGSYTGTGAAGNFVSLGYEPQFVLVKRTNTTGNWLILDNMRGIVTGGVDAGLFPNLSNAEDSTNDYLSVNATGFELTGVSTTVNASGSTYIYIAIRRGPMKVPTTGTSVFVPYAYAGSGAGTYTTGINQDLFFAKSRGSSSYVWNWYDRLRGPNLRLQSNATNAEASATGVTAFNNTSMVFGASDGFSSASPFGGPYIGYALSRAPGFFDEVCYTGTGANTTVAHNLAAVPELMIVKRRNDVTNWHVWNPTIFAIDSGYITLLNSTVSVSNSGTSFNSTAPTSTVFSVGTNTSTNASGGTYVAYLFASCPGVSKVGTYTGNGSSQTINCGFTGGARFVLLKRISAGSDWYVWDSARGIVAGNDPHLSLNTTAAEVTTDDSVDTDSTGFVVNQLSATDMNVNTATYIFLAIA